VLDVDQVGLDLVHKAGKAVLDLLVQESAQELPCHRGCHSTWVTGDSTGKDTVDIFVVLGERWTISGIVMPVKDRNLVLPAKCLGQVLGIDLYTAQGMGWEFVRREQDSHLVV
jgi:hypothetical protein